MEKLTFLLIAFFAMFTSVVTSQTKEQSGLIAKDATLTKISSDFKFTEGPAVDSKGNVFFTDQPNDKIMKWSTDGTLSVYMEGAGRSNGCFSITRATWCRARIRTTSSG